MKASLSKANLHVGLSIEAMMMSFWPLWPEIISVAVATKRLAYKMAALFSQLCSPFSVPLSSPPKALSSS